VKPKKTKRQRERTKKLGQAVRWRSVSEETEHGDVLLTRVSRKPTAYKVEAVSPSGEIIHCGLQKCPKGVTGWDVLMPQSSAKGEAGIKTMRWRTKAAAIRFIEMLELVPHEKAIEGATL